MHSGQVSCELITYDMSSTCNDQNVFKICNIYFHPFQRQTGYTKTNSVLEANSTFGQILTPYG